MKLVVALQKFSKFWERLIPTEKNRQLKYWKYWKPKHKLTSPWKRSVPYEDSFSATQKWFHTLSGCPDGKKSFSFFKIKLKSGENTKQKIKNITSMIYYQDNLSIITDRSMISEYARHFSYMLPLKMLTGKWYEWKWRFYMILTSNPFCSLPAFNNLHYVFECA